MNQAQSKTIVTPSALVYEDLRLVSDHVTISRFLLGLRESHHPVYFFAEIVSAFCSSLLWWARIYRSLSARCARLVVFSHIFWGF